MKKYKLIKEYPNSPKIGCVVKEGSMEYYDMEVEHFPEFWEPIVEKDYEILSIVYAGDSESNKARILTETDQIDSWERGYGGDLWVIHTVKRLSDGEVFTVGDKVSRKTEEDIFTIKELMLCKDGYIRVLHEHGSSALKYFDLHKKPLFTTEDGVDIYEGETYYAHDNCGRLKERKGGDGLMTHLEDIRKRTFSTAEAYEQYQPKYSKKNIQDAINNIKLWGVKNTNDGIKTLYMLTEDELKKELNL